MIGVTDIMADQMKGVKNRGLADWRIGGLADRDTPQRNGCVTSRGAGIGAGIGPGPGIGTFRVWARGKDRVSWGWG